MDGSQGLIEFAIFMVQRIIALPVGLIRVYMAADLDELVDLIHVGVNAHTNCDCQCSTCCTSFQVVLHHPYLSTSHVTDDLHPQWAVATATDAIEAINV